jgi:hypothetical protein
MHFFDEDPSLNMVQIHLKKGEESIFLVQIPVTTALSEVIPKLATLYNDRRRLERLITSKSIIYS